MDEYFNFKLSNLLIIEKKLEKLFRFIANTNDHSTYSQKVIECFFELLSSKNCILDSFCQDEADYAEFLSFENDYFNKVLNEICGIVIPSQFEYSKFLTNMAYFQKQICRKEMIDLDFEYYKVYLNNTDASTIQFFVKDEAYCEVPNVDNDINYIQYVREYFAPLLSDKVEDFIVLQAAIMSAISLMHKNSKGELFDQFMDFFYEHNLAEKHSAYYFKILGIVFSGDDLLNKGVGSDEKRYSK